VYTSGEVLCGTLSVSNELVIKAAEKAKAQARPKPYRPRRRPSSPWARPKKKTVKKPTRPRRLWRR